MYETFYLSHSPNISRVLNMTGLSIDELESIVGYFAKHSHRAGLMRGEVVVMDENIIIRHHFSKKILWTGELQ